VIKFVSDLRQAGGFLRFFSTNKTNRYDIADILVKVALNTIILSSTISFYNNSELYISNINISDQPCKIKIWSEIKVFFLLEAFRIFGFAIF
jgi:UDP-glucose 4-epimerase